MERIAALAAEGGPAMIVEIGPGRGALTELLLESGAAVHAIELDPRMIQALTARFSGHPRLAIHHADILATDLAQWGAAAVAGNIPYYITSPILERIFRARRAIGRATLLVQREVAERLIAQPGGRDYGYLSVVAQSWSRPTLAAKVPRGAFRPPPKVDSAVVQLAIPPEAPEDTEAFLRFAGQAFRHKRKTLRNNLQHLYAGFDWNLAPEKNLRAEQLDIASLRALWSRLRAHDILVVHDDSRTGRTGR